MTTALIVAVGRPTFDLPFATEVAAAAHLVLATLDLQTQGVNQVVTEPIDLEALLDQTLDAESTSTVPADVVIVLQTTFTDSTFVGRIADRTVLPIVVWSFPEERTGGRLRLNSLCGANLAAYLLRRRQHRVEFVHIDPDDAGASNAVQSAVDRVLDHDAPTGSPTATGRTTPSTHVHRDSSGNAGRRLASALAGECIGVIGDAPDGFEPCIGDAAQVRELTGIDVDRVTLATMFAKADAMGDTARQATTARVRATLDVGDDVSGAGFDQSIGLYGGMSRLVAERGWRAVATRCWPECMTEYGGAACTPMAMLTEDGIPAACEADLFGAVTALILRHIADSDPFVADLVDVDVADGTSVVWHCGVAPVTLADPSQQPVAITHPNRHRAIVNQFALKPGRVTLARLSQSAGEISMVVGGGEILARPRPFSGTCGVLRWDATVPHVMEVVFGRGLEHHVGLVYGDHQEALRSLAGIWNIPVIEFGGYQPAAPPTSPV